MGNLYFTLKPANRITGKIQEGYLINYDPETEGSDILFNWPQIDNKSDRAFLESGFSGLYIDSDYYYLCSQFCVFIIDRKTRETVHIISHQLMNILHGLTVYKDKIYITSSGNDMILIFNRLNFEFEKAVHLKKNISLHLFKRNKDYRFLHKSKTKLHYFHLNDIHIYDNSLFITTKSSPKNGKGLFIKTDLDFLDVEILTDELKGPHDGIKSEEEYIFTQSKSGNIAILNLADNQLSNVDLNINPQHYFIRGLSVDKDLMYLGLSNYRDDLNQAAKILVLNRLNYKLEKEIVLDNYYPENIGCAVHTLFVK